MRPKILYVTYMGLTEPLVESQALAYLKGLSKEENSIHILSFEKGRFVSKERMLNIERELKKFNIGWTFVKYHKHPLFLAKIFDLLTGFFFSFWITLTKDIEIIHSRGSMPAFFSFFVSRILGRKFVFDVRGLMAREYIDGNMWKKKGFYYKITNALEKMILRHSDAAVVLTEKVKNIVGMKDYNGRHIIGKISVIPSSVDMDRFNIDGETSKRITKELGLEGRFVFLYVGSLGTWYMFKEMAEFIKINRDNFKEPFFLIVTQSEKNKVEDILKEAGFKGYEYKIIYSEHKEIPRYINIANAGMMFIKPCFSKQASSPTKFAEYLACGVPVVLNSGIGDCDRIINDYKVGVMVNSFCAGDCKEAGARLKGLVEQENGVLERCRDAAIKEFSLKNAIVKYNRIYKNLLK